MNLEPPARRLYAVWRISSRGKHKTASELNAARQTVVVGFVAWSLLSAVFFWNLRVRCTLSILFLFHNTEAVRARHLCRRMSARQNEHSMAAKKLRLCEILRSTVRVKFSFFNIRCFQPLPEPEPLIHTAHPELIRCAHVICLAYWWLDQRVLVSAGHSKAINIEIVTVNFCIVISMTLKCEFIFYNARDILLNYSMITSLRLCM